MTFDISKLDNFPTQPGVYLMKDKNSHVIYVGKAINIRNRVRQYFSPGRNNRPIIPSLVSQISSIDTIIVYSEKEALLLENTLIKQHQPKYNALLKDDKTYVALKVNNKHPWPMVQIVRYRGRPEPDGLYFGPYTSAFSARAVLELIHKMFPLRQCSDQELARRTRPCILYDMKRCIAPCVGKCTKEEYDTNVTRTIKFLRGQDKEIIKELYEEMARHSDELNFEEADNVLKLIRQIERTLEGQTVAKPLGGDADALAIYRQGVEVIVVKLEIRSGKLLGSRHFNFASIAEDDAELLSSFILQHYKELAELPSEILTPIDLPDAEVIAEIIAADKPRKVYIINPQRGEKRALVEMSYLNAESTFKKEKDSNWRTETQRFAPGLHVHVSHGGDRKEHFERLADFDLIVTSYSLLPRDEEILKGQPFHLLILDEAQYVKNPNTKWADVATLPFGTPPPLRDRHPHGKPPRRALEPHDVPLARLLGHPETIQPRLPHSHREGR